MRRRWFAGWIVVGALGGLTVLGALSIGIFVLPAFGLAFAVVARKTKYPLDLLGVLVGIGAMCLFVAYRNRDYQPCVPGAFTCGGFDPHPWLAAGITLVAVGFGSYLLLRLWSGAHLCRRGAK